jgi:hypothetical protein
MNFREYVSYIRGTRAMAAGEWERFATEIVFPGLRSAAVELNRRDGVLAECTEYPLGDGCLLWIARRPPQSPFIWPAGSLTIQDQPELAQVRVEETVSNTPTGKPVSTCLSLSEVSVSWVRARALAFAERITA